MVSASETQAFAETKSGGWTTSVVNYPTRILTLCLSLIILAAIGLSGHHKDTSFDAFLKPQNPILIAKKKARSYFDIDDAIVVSMAARNGASMFTPDRLEQFRILHNALLNVPGARRNDIISIVSETYMDSDDGDLIVEDILPDGRISTAEADAAWTHVQTMPPFMDMLVSADASALLIVMPVEDPNHSSVTYKTTFNIAQSLSTGDLRVDIAGTAAANARFADLIDLNTATFIPATVIVVIFVTFLALRQWNAMLGPLLVMSGSVAVTLGSMGWLGFHYYMISTALPVVVMAISIADCLHISIKYFDLFKDDPSISSKTAAHRALSATWKPVVLTSLTTIFGFAGLGLSTSTPPLKEFAFFASMGVASACAFSLLIVPSLLVALKVRPKTGRQSGETIATRLDSTLLSTTKAAVRYPIRTIAGAALISSLLLAVGTQVQFNNGVDIQFKKQDEIRVANTFMKQKFAGNGTVDIIISADQENAILSPDALQSIRALQDQVSSVPVINKVTSIVDYISMMHHHLTGADAGKLPTRKNAPVQYMFLYESSSDSNSFQEEIDYQRQNALIRTKLNKDSYLETRDGLTQVHEIIENWNTSNDLNLHAEVTGRTAVTYEWMQILQRNHAFSVISASFFVFLAILFFLRNVVDAVVATLPVICGLTAIYAAMTLFQIPLSPATSMCSAISTGLGVDFGVHLVEQIRRDRMAGKLTQPIALAKYVLVARACFFSAVSLALGLSVVLLSWVPTVQAYGFLIAVGAVSALLGALAITPALSSLTHKPSDA